MGVRLQRQPLRTCLAADLHAGATGTISSRHGRLTISIGATVDRVLDDPVDGGVTWPTPSRVAARLLHGQIEIVFVQPAQRLARAAQLRDLVEDKRNGLLHAPVRILLVAITCLDEAERGRHHQFAAACLLVPGR